MVSLKQNSNQSLGYFGYSDYYNHLSYLKILKKVKKKGIAKIEDIPIVDDTPSKSKYNYGNAFYPTEFTENSNVNELELLLKYLINIRQISNFRTIEERNSRNELNNER